MKNKKTKLKHQKTSELAKQFRSFLKEFNNAKKMCEKGKAAGPKSYFQKVKGLENIQRKTQKATEEGLRYRIAVNKNLQLPSS